MLPSDADFQLNLPPRPPEMNSVFISYRRADTSEFIPRLAQLLQGMPGVSTVFHDRTSVKVGANFVQEIDAAVESCGCFISVIGPRWLSEAGETGPNRLHDANDFVRIEILSALERGLPIIPILVDKAKMPLKQDVPSEIHALLDINAIEVHEASLESTGKDISVAVKDAHNFSLVSALPSWRGQGLFRTTTATDYLNGVAIDYFASIAKAIIVQKITRWNHALFILICRSRLETQGRRVITLKSGNFLVAAKLLKVTLLWVALMSNHHRALVVLCVRTSHMTECYAATPNPSIDLTRSGRRAWPRGAEVYVAPCGQARLPSRAAQLKRYTPGPKEE